MLPVVSSSYIKSRKFLTIYLQIPSLQFHLICVVNSETYDLLLNLFVQQFVDYSYSVKSFLNLDLKLFMAIPNPSLPDRFKRIVFKSIPLLYNFTFFS